MSNFPVNHVLGFGEEKAYSTRKSAFLGQIAYTVDGRRFRYALNSSAAALAAGVPVQTAAQAATSLYADALAAALANGVGATVATGITTIALTTVDGASGENTYVDGYLYVKVGPGAGAYLIKEHTAATSLAGMNITFYAGDKIDKVAHTTATRYALQANPYSNVIVMPATKTGAVLGVAHTSVPASNYFWLQDEGATPVMMASATSAAGHTITAGTTAGELVAQTTVLADQSKPMFGRSIHIAATTGVIDMVLLQL